jgi:hypothetical protein
MPLPFYTTGWFPVTYNLCFKWTSDTAPEVTLTRSQIDETDPVVTKGNVHGYEEAGSVTAVETGGVVKLHSTLSYLL